MNRRFFAQSIAAGLVAVASTQIGYTQAAGPDAAQVAKWLDETVKGIEELKSRMP